RHYEGRVMNHLGDGSLSIFTDAAQAVRAAQAMQTALHQHNRSAPANRQMPLRIGLHSGKALVGHETVLGLAVNLAARVCETAVAGEIVVSEATYEMGGGGNGRVCPPWPAKTKRLHPSDYYVSKSTLKNNIFSTNHQEYNANGIINSNHSNITDLVVKRSFPPLLLGRLHHDRRVNSSGFLKHFSEKYQVNRFKNGYALFKVI
ncbi:MAG: adenylate/guanylate cyclase domain-containing protein, partial [Anaerolineae bacterium]